MLYWLIIQSVEVLLDKFFPFALFASAPSKGWQLSTSSFSGTTGSKHELPVLLLL